jgi:hypothetical protein
MSVWRNELDGSKIDSIAVLGLAGVSNSLAYKVHEIEKHFHSAGSWFETATTPAGTTHTADRIGSGTGAFQLDAGNDTWGAWVQILGSTDTPARATNAYFDPHEILIEGAERENTYFVQFCHGHVDAATAYSAGTYTELVVGIDATKKFKTITQVHTGRAAAGSMLWARCMVPGINTGTFDFFIGIHEYVG